jgi:plastocyanin
MELTEKAHASPIGWRSLLHLAAMGNLAVLLFMALTQQDTLALGLSLAIIAGLGLLRLRGGLFGILLLALLFADITLWTVSGAVNNLVHREGGLSLLLPAFLGVISFTGLVAAVGTVLNRRQPQVSSRSAAWVGAAALALLALASAASLLVQKPPVASAEGGALHLDSKNMVYSSAALESQPGEITLTLANEDLWWHTFTIDELGVDLQVPMGAEREVTFHAPAGEYHFYCAIPGHETIGMHGTLVVSEEAGQP